MIHQLLRKATHNRTIHQSLLQFGRFTSRMRALPDFLIIGAAKCGTTSLFDYLKQHPRIAYTLVKEVHFFDRNFKEGTNWYRGHFPTNVYKTLSKVLNKSALLVGEATPYYLCHPLIPQRVSQLLPRARLIIMLRNPIDRAYSKYNEMVALGFEKLSFQEGLEKEAERLHGEVERMVGDGDYISDNYYKYAYLARGIYIDQIKAWMKVFPREQILILKSEDFFDNPPLVFARVIRFLGLPDWQLQEFRNLNPGNYRPMDPATREYLAHYFAPHNQRLYDYLGIDYDWD